METLACWSCGAKLSERALFCGTCGTQVRCKACRDILEPNACACISCGVLLQEAGAANVSGGGSLPSRTINNLEYSQTDKSVSLHFAFTDEAAGSLSEALSVLITSRLGSLPTRHQRVPGGESRIIDHERLASPETPEDESLVSASQPESTRTIELEPDAEKLRHVFKFEDERLRLINPRLRADSQRDYGRRLTLLFLYAHELEGRELVPRASLNTLMKEVVVLDSNYRSWLAKSVEVVRNGEMVSLSVPGREEARSVLSDVLDASASDKWLPGKYGQARSKAKAQADQRTGGEGKGGRRKTESRSNLVEQWLVAWRSLALGVDGHNILKDRSLADKGVFGLWAIRKSVGDDGKVVSRLNLSRFLYEAFELKVDGRSLERALKSDSVKGKVLNYEGTRFQIQPPGVQYAEEMAGISSESAAVAVNSNGSSSTLP